MVTLYEGTNPEDVYPNTEFLPASGMERGNVKLVRGDIETPLWPSLEHSFRLSENETEKYLPKIPAQPIGYGDAAKIFASMNYRAVPEGELVFEEKSHVTDFVHFQAGPVGYQTRITHWEVKSRDHSAARAHHAGRRYRFSISVFQRLFKMWWALYEEP